MPPGTTSTVASLRRWASCTSRARRIASSSAARTAGSRSARARASAAAGTGVAADVDAVEPAGGLADGVRAAGPHVVADRPYDVDGRLDIEGGAGQHVAVGVGVGLLAAQVHSRDHRPSLGKRAA